MINLKFDEVLELSRNSNVIPIIETLFSSGITPLGAFETMTRMQHGAFLLESAEHGVWSRYSFVGLGARGFLKQEFGEPAQWVSEGGFTALPKNLQQTLPHGALDALELVQQAWTSPSIADLPPLTSGLVGALAWDSVREVEHLPNRKPTAYPVPVLNFILMRNLLVFDHQLSRIQLVSNLFVEGQNEDELHQDYLAAIEQLNHLKTQLARLTATYLADVSPVSSAEANPNHTHETFTQVVKKAQRHVEAGDVFQVVLSQRFDRATESTLDHQRVCLCLSRSMRLSTSSMSASSLRSSC